MTHRTKLLAALLPIAAIGFLATETIGSAYAGEPFVLAQAKTLDAAPRSRGAIRGARPTPERPADDAEGATVNDTMRYAGHPPRQDGRSLPQTGDGFVLLADAPRSIGPRGARS